MDQLENINPDVFNVSKARGYTSEDLDELHKDEVDAREVFDILRDIKDPEHPLTLEQLRVIELSNINVDNLKNEVKVNFTPTIPHCSMATLIGLSIRVLLLRTLPTRLKVVVEVTPGTHASEHAVNKQLADKERVAAALENRSLIAVIQQCIGNVNCNPNEDQYNGQNIEKLLLESTKNQRNNTIISDDYLSADIDDLYSCSMIYLRSMKTLAVDLKSKNSICEGV